LWEGHKNLAHFPRIIQACQRSERSKANCQAVNSSNKRMNIFFDLTTLQFKIIFKKCLSCGRIDGWAICFWKLLNFSNVKLKAGDEPFFLAFSEYLNFTCSYVLFLMELNPWTAMAFESKFFIRSTELDKTFLLITKNCINIFFGDFHSRVVFNW